MNAEDHLPVGEAERRVALAPVGLRGARLIFGASGGERLGRRNRMAQQLVRGVGQRGKEGAVVAEARLVLQQQIVDCPNQQGGGAERVSSRARLIPAVRYTPGSSLQSAYGRCLARTR